MINRLVKGLGLRESVDSAPSWSSCSEGGSRLLRDLDEGLQLDEAHAEGLVREEPKVLFPEGWAWESFPGGKRTDQDLAMSVVLK